MNEVLIQNDVATQSSNQKMTGLGVVYRDSRYNAVLAFNESIVLLNSVCELSIRNSQPSSYSQQNFIDHFYLYQQNFVIIFSDEPEPKTNYTGTLITIENKEIKIKCFKWYGKGIENTDPFVIEHTSRPNTVFLVKIKTTAFESAPRRRKVELSIWTKL